jgi:N-acyl-D-amino-acid deacylase
VQKGIAVLGLALVALACGGGGGGAPTVPLPTFHAGAGQIAVSGPDVPGAARFDDAVKAFMLRWNVPGATLAVARSGRLVLARGYGWADFEAGEPVTPVSRFRVGSISKVLTATAALQLADEGRLQLDAPFLEALPGFAVPAGGDPRLAQVTVRQLLQHSGGWDRTRSPDYTQWQVQAAETLGVTAPASAEEMARWLLGRRLDTAPGQRFCYSNVGYALLGRVIEAASGQGYEQRIREHVLAPLGVQAMTVGGGRAAERQPGEVRDYSVLRFPSVYPGEGEVPAPYAWSLAAQDAQGGWVASAADLTRLLTALDGSRAGSPLVAATWAAMRADPHLVNASGATTFGQAGLPGRWFYGLGLFVNADEPGAWVHGGSYMGTQAIAGRTATGEVFAFLVNTRVEGEPAQTTFTAELDALVPAAIAGGPFGAEEDLYPRVPSEAPVVAPSAAWSSSSSTTARSPATR